MLWARVRLRAMANGLPGDRPRHAAAGGRPGPGEPVGRNRRRRPERGVPRSRSRGIRTARPPPASGPRGRWSRGEGGERPARPRRCRSRGRGGGQARTRASARSGRGAGGRGSAGTGARPPPRTPAGPVRRTLSSRRSALIPRTAASSRSRSNPSRARSADLPVPGPPSNSVVEYEPSAILSPSIRSSGRRSHSPWPRSVGQASSGGRRRRTVHVSSRHRRARPLLGWADIGGVISGRFKEGVEVGAVGPPGPQASVEGPGR